MLTTGHSVIHCDINKQKNLAVLCHCKMMTDADLFYLDHTMTIYRVNKMTEKHFSETIKLAMVDPKTQTAQLCCLQRSFHVSLGNSKGAGIAQWLERRTRD